MKLEYDENENLTLGIAEGEEVSAVTDESLVYDLSMDESADLEFETEETELEMSVGEAIQNIQYDTPAYTGEYEFTPTEDTQTVSIQGLRARHDITINPIPSNYGRISWDGVTLKVY